MITSPFFWINGILPRLVIEDTLLTTGTISSKSIPCINVPTTGLVTLDIVTTRHATHQHQSQSLWTPVQGAQPNHRPTGFTFHNKGLCSAIDMTNQPDNVWACLYRGEQWLPTHTLWVIHMGNCDLHSIIVTIPQLQPFEFVKAIFFARTVLSDPNPRTIMDNLQDDEDTNGPT